MTPEQLAEAGFMSVYAAVNHREDIAETATWPIVGPDYRDAGLPDGPAPLTNDFACVAMQTYGERNVPQRLAAVYAKLSFLHALGMLTTDVFDRCTGDHTGLPNEHEGIAIYEEGALQNVFGTDPTAAIGTLDGDYVFTLSAGGMAEFMDTTHGATLTLRLSLGPAADRPVEQVSWPRGLYSLAIGQPNHFELRMPDAPSADFNVTDGFVLVAAASNDRIVGSVFATEAFRPHAPVPVPQTFDPPLQFRFMLTR
jgi:hypothetical protein